jgi:hypothetical protein
MNVFAPVAVWGFWILLGLGWWLGELHVKGITIAVLLWLAGLAACSLIVPAGLFMPYVAMLDIALVLIIFKGDIRLR